MTPTQRYRKQHPDRLLWRRAKSRSEKSGIPFSITYADVVIPDRCPILGIALRNGAGTGSGGNHDSPSLDRIKPELGYVPDNVQVISTLANAMKNSATPEQLLTFADWVFRAYRK